MKTTVLSLLASIFLCFSDAAAAPVSSPDYLIPIEPLVKISCAKQTSGSAEIVGNNTYLTASHVVAGNDRCILPDGSTATVVFDNRQLDFAVLMADTTGKRQYRLNCQGMRKGELYLAIGYAEAGLVIQPITGTGAHKSYHDRKTKVTVLNTAVATRPFELPAVYPGMSGGPVLDMQGRVVGIVSGVIDDPKNAAAIREVKDTFLCKRGNKPAV